MNALISSFLFVAKTSLTACIIVVIVLAVRLLAGKKLQGGSAMRCGVWSCCG